MRREEAALTDDGGTVDRDRSRAPAFIAISAALVGLIVLVALGTRAGHGGSGRLSNRHVPNAVSDDLLTILFFAYVLGLIGVAVLFWKSKERWQPVRSPWIRKMVRFSWVYGPVILKVSAGAAALPGASAAATGKATAASQATSATAEART